MKIVICYDIKEDKKRNKFAKEMLRFGIRTQKSFFEAEVRKSDLKEIKRVAESFSNSEDLVTVYEVKGEFERIGDIDYLPIDDIVF